MRLLMAAVAGLFMVACLPADTSPSGPSDDPPPSDRLVTDAPSIIEIVAEEYRYEGIPAKLGVGTRMSLRNGGAEPHELVVLRLRENSSIEGFVQLSEHEMLERAEVIGVLVASADETAEGTITIVKAGSYVAVCFISVGAGADHEHVHDHSAAAEPSQVQHYAIGMYASFVAG